MDNQIDNIRKKLLKRIDEMNDIDLCKVLSLIELFNEYGIERAWEMCTGTKYNPDNF